MATGTLWLRFRCAGPRVGGAAIRAPPGALRIRRLFFKICYLEDMWPLGLGAVLAGSLVAVTGIARGQDDCRLARVGHQQPGDVSPGRQCGRTAQRDGDRPTPVEILLSTGRRAPREPGGSRRMGSRIEDGTQYCFRPDGSARHPNRGEAEAGATTAPGHSYEVLDRYTTALRAASAAPLSAGRTRRCSPASPPARPATCLPHNSRRATSLAVRPFFQCPGYSNRPFALGWDKATDDLCRYRCLPTTSTRTARRFRCAVYRDDPPAQPWRSAAIQSCLARCFRSSSAPPSAGTTPGGTSGHLLRARRGLGRQPDTNQVNLSIV